MGGNLNNLVKEVHVAYSLKQVEDIVRTALKNVE